MDEYPPIEYSRIVEKFIDDFWEDAFFRFLLRVDPGRYDYDGDGSFYHETTHERLFRSIYCTVELLQKCMETMINSVEKKEKTGIGKNPAILPDLIFRILRNPRKALLLKIKNPQMFNKICAEYPRIVKSIKWYWKND